MSTKEASKAVSLAASISGTYGGVSGSADYQGSWKGSSKTANKDSEESSTMNVKVRTSGRCPWYEAANLMPSKTDNQLTEDKANKTIRRLSGACTGENTVKHKTEHETDCSVACDKLYKATKQCGTTNDCKCSWDANADERWWDDNAAEPGPPTSKPTKKSIVDRLEEEKKRIDLQVRTSSRHSQAANPQEPNFFFVLCLSSERNS